MVPRLATYPGVRGLFKVRSVQFFFFFLLSQLDLVESDIFQYDDLIEVKRGERNVDRKRKKGTENDGGLKSGQNGDGSS